MHGQDLGGAARGQGCRGVVSGRGGVAKTVGARRESTVKAMWAQPVAVGTRPKAVEAWPRTWGCCQGPWGHGEDCGGKAKGRWGAAKAVGA